MHRKVVTVVFCDVVGSTALGESVDPEALRGLLARYFQRMQAIVESHGGSVEKFIGDAVMAVFGVPSVHEDDALRACRSAVEMRTAFPKLGIEGRIGVNTGEVVTGTEERLVTGDAVNVAARLQQAAAPGEVLIGETTLELVAGAVEAEPVEPLELKGKTQLITAHRLTRVLDAPERSHESRFVGRQAEVALIRDAWDRANDELRCEPVTIVGDPGIGKSRLVAEALAAIDSRVIRGRCLPYGHGVTYWPVVEALKQLGTLPSDPAAAAAIRSLLGESVEGTSADEIAWAFRKLIAEHAPLVVVFDDIQWGEETFLDLVEGIALLSADAPLLLVCMTRPELLDRRPQWPVAIRLEPLDADAAAELVGADLSPPLRERIAQAAAGNPLFLTEMVAMAAENDDVEVPATLRALLAARLDQLETSERGVLERGSVEGELFHRGAVQALAPDGAQVTPHLAALVRRELIRPDQTQLPGDDGFRFRHLLIRDAAYEALPKAVRAELHEHFADWLEGRGPELVELDEILGYHLEQAAGYKHELGEPGPGLAARAGERLAAAGRRALWRDDNSAATGLLERALALTRPIGLDVMLELELAGTFYRADPRRAAAIAEAAAERARAEGDHVGEAVARNDAAVHRCNAGMSTVDEVEALAREALSQLDERRDHAALAHVWFAIGSVVANTRGRFEEYAQASERALHHSRLAGQHPSELFGLEVAVAIGPRPADEALRTLDAVAPPAPHPFLAQTRAWLIAMLGGLDEAWPLALSANERFRELGGGGEHILGELARLSGDDAAAADYYGQFCDLLEGHGQQAALSTYLSARGRMLCAIGQFDEAERCARKSHELGDEEDAATQTLWRQVQALVHAHRGEHQKAESDAREAIAVIDATDALNLQADAYCDLAEVLAGAGRTEEAATALEQALDRYERKKNLAMVAQVRPKLEALRAGAAT